MARLVFLGTPVAAVAPLEALVASGHDVAAVVTRPEARRGRGAQRSPSPVAQAAARLGLPVSDHLEDVLDAGAELGVVVAYGSIIPGASLDRLPMVNLHFSLLPRWRGAAPVERAILAGDTSTGVCLMRMEAGLDTGPVLARQFLAMGDEHAATLTQRLSHLGADMLVTLLQGGTAEALAEGEPQRGEPTYAKKLTTEELRLDWRRPAIELGRVVRLDRAWTTFRGNRLRVLDALPLPEVSLDAPPGTLRGESVATGSGALELLVVQPEGRRPMPAPQWRRGVREGSDERLGSADSDS